jgi:hypothetical protein
MKKQIALLVVVATLACCSISQASITGAAWLPSSCSNLTCTAQTFDGTTLHMTGTQLSLNTARMSGAIITDTPGDPNLFLGASVNNDTANAWNGYRVNVVMDVLFNFVGFPTVDNPSPDTPPTDNWILAALAPPTQQVGGPYNGKYEGSIFYSAGTQIEIGDELDFNYEIHFASSTDYTVVQEMIPSLVPVPEPSTVVLLTLGGLGFAMRLRRNSRKAA